jgi:hypothetical protein
MDDRCEVRSRAAASRALEIESPSRSRSPNLKADNSGRRYVAMRRLSDDFALSLVVDKLEKRADRSSGARSVAVSSRKPLAVTNGDFRTRNRSTPIAASTLDAGGRELVSDAAEERVEGVFAARDGRAMAGMWNVRWGCAC